MHYLNKVKNNIFPVSQEQNDIRKALQEWEYRGTSFDIEAATETCQLCDHEEIRYRFEIVNKINGNRLLIGSQCIRKYNEIAVVDEKGNRLETALANKKVNRDRNKLITEVHTRSVLNSLVKLSRISGEKLNFEDLLKEYQENGSFSPRQLSTTIWRLGVNKIPFEKKYFKAAIRKPAWKHQLFALEAWKIERIWECFSSTQKKMILSGRTDLFNRQETSHV